mmetsp:Transcript_5969/g.10656  ORF Transcript_5969/g.10656 Transcript_5969/m.10656 type:complete len:470 (+) Transcript_5969:565-1974(+)
MDANALRPRSKNTQNVLQPKTKTSRKSSSVARYHENFYPETENPSVSNMENNNSENFQGGNFKNALNDEKQMARKSGATNTVRASKAHRQRHQILGHEENLAYKSQIQQDDQCHIKDQDGNHVESKMYQRLTYSRPSLVVKADDYTGSEKPHDALSNDLHSQVLQAPAAQPTIVERPKSRSWLARIAIAVVEGAILLVALLLVTPNYQPPTSSTQAFFHTVLSGKPFSFEIDVEAWPAPSYQWRLNGVDVPGAVSNRLSVDAAKLEHSGTYTCVVENMAGKYLWEEGYVNVIESVEKSSPIIKDRIRPRDFGAKGEPDRVRNARMCLLQRAPEEVLRSASVDGGAAVIAAGESAGYLDCFLGLKRQVEQAGPQRVEKQARALHLLRSMHGSSTQRSVLVNVVSALDDLALAKQNSQPLDEATAALAFEAGLFCASTPQCSAGNRGNARTRVVRLVMSALVGIEDTPDLP